VAAIGVGDLVATSLYAIALTEGLLSIVAVIGSLYPISTVLLARFFLHERLRRDQALGEQEDRGAVAGPVTVQKAVHSPEEPASSRPVVLGRPVTPVVDVGSVLGDDIDGDDDFDDFDDLDDPDGLLGAVPGRPVPARNGERPHLRRDEDLDLLGDVDPGTDLDDGPAVGGADGRVPAAGEARR